MPNTQDAANTTTRLVAKVVRSVASSQRFEFFGDFREAVVDALRRLRIRPRPEELAAAIALVQSNHPLWTPSLTEEPRHREQRPEPPVFSRADAAAFLRARGLAPKSFGGRS